MNKIFTKILISVFMVGIFLLPFSGQVSIENQKITTKIETQKVYAQALGDAGYYFQWSGGSSGTNWFVSNTSSGCTDYQATVQGNGNTITIPCAYMDDTQADITISQSATGEKYSIRSDAENQKQDPEFGCSIFFFATPVKCFNTLLFYIVFRPLAWIMTVTGELFDYFLFYSTSSEAYTSGFISKAWGAVRDISNIFFIVALLFIAIKTVLSINVSNNKKLVGMVVVMALLINFSLFTTQVVVDASNILARVFYNEITAVDKSGNSIVGGSKEKSVSLALVSIFNPQRIIDNDNEKSDYSDDPAGSILLIILLSIVVVAITIYVFVSVAFLFVARVIGLWIAMIFSPLAFASKTVSFKIPGFGWDNWGKDLVRYSFMAPIFIFFLYVIVLLADSLSGLVGFSSQQGDAWATKFMNVLIPFILISVLLLKARKLAVEYSGDIGAGVMTAVKMGGGLVGGAALGAVAFGGSKFIGGVASRYLSTSGEALKEKAKEGGMSGYVARMQLKAANYGTKATFDARQTLAGNKLSKLSGMNFQSFKPLGSKAGGYTGMVERKTEKLTKESELYKTKMTDTEVQKWSEDQEFKYYQDRDEAKKNNTLESFEKERGKEPPKKYTSANELNHDRMKAFQENIGHSGLMGSMIYSTIKTVDKENYKESEEYKTAHRKEEYETEKRKSILEHGKSGSDQVWDEKAFAERFNNDYQAKHFGAGKELNFNEDIAKKINKQRVQEAKVIVGTVAGLATGGVLGAGAFGLAGGVIGSQAGGVGGALLGLNDQVATDAAKKFGGALAKEEKRLKGVNERIKEFENIIEEQNETLKTISEDDSLKDIIDVTKDSKGKVVKLNNIDKEKLTDAIQDNDINIKRYNSELETKIKAGASDSELESIKINLKNAKAKAEKLNSIKNYKEKTADIQNKIYNLKKDTHGTSHDKKASEAKVNVATPSAETKAPHSADSHDEASHSSDDHSHEGEASHASH